MPKSSGHLVVAINPTASFGKRADAAGIAIAELEAAGYQVEALSAESFSHLQELTRDAIRGHTRALVVVGGDGMVHLGVGVAREKKVPLGVIPSGTGNDFARHLGLVIASPRDAAKNLVEALDREPSVMDVGVARGAEGFSRSFACVFSGGFDAIVNERANRLRFPKGRHRYTLALLIELAKLRPLTYTLTIDGVEETGRYLLVAVANTHSFGGGMKVTPEASVVDGHLDVFTLAPLSRLAFLRIYPRVFSGTHVTDPRVSIRRATSVKLDSPGVIAYADGEALRALPLEVTVEPQGLQIYA